MLQNPTGIQRKSQYMKKKKKIYAQHVNNIFLHKCTYCKRNEVLSRKGNALFTHSLTETHTYIQPPPTHTHTHAHTHSATDSNVCPFRYFFLSTILLFLLILLSLLLLLFLLDIIVIFNNSYFKITTHSPIYLGGFI